MLDISREEREICAKMRNIVLERSHLQGKRGEWTDEDRINYRACNYTIPIKYAALGMAINRIERPSTHQRAEKLGLTPVQVYKGWAQGLFSFLYEFERPEPDCTSHAMHGNLYAVQIPAMTFSRS